VSVGPNRQFSGTRRPPGKWDLVLGPISSLGHHHAVAEGEFGEMAGSTAHSKGDHYTAAEGKLGRLQEQDANREGIKHLRGSLGDGRN